MIELFNLRSEISEKSNLKIYLNGEVIHDYIVGKNKEEVSRLIRLKGSNEIFERKDFIESWNI